MQSLPKKYSHLEVEQKWASSWCDSGLYQCDPTKPSFAIDTPPPTVSGSLHIGHVFSYTHTDIIARYRRMLGEEVFYPMGWDDNGLPTERRVQNKFSIRCNPTLPYDAEWKPNENAESDSEVSRQNFIEACAIVTEEDEVSFEELWRRLGLSVDWNETYQTVGTKCRKVSQYSFIDLYNKGYVYSSEAPTMWDVTFQTALAQADIEDREKQGAYHDIRFAVDESEESFVISTTRPEMLAACVAVVAHPKDERYQSLFGQHAVTPLFGCKVPIVASEHADPEKGTGILMVCTFGDVADVDWWKSSSLPIRQILSREGRLLEVDFSSEPWSSTDSELANKNYAEISGLRPHAARRKIAEMLSEEGFLETEPKKITHPVKFYEKGDLPIEFVTTRQWFISVLEHKEKLLAAGEKINWCPDFMKSRYSHWVEGLSHDWCISRQRYFGVPFPVWYPLDDAGEPDYENPLLASTESLPVDPQTDTPPGFTADQRGKPGGFIGDPDVMDTWATSSLTPQIATGWPDDPEKHKQLFPMDIRPQSHEIIRTWAFYTIAKALFHFDEIPWKNLVVSGWILDPDRKKMSKSKGNVVTPGALLDEYSSDAIRYWAGRARLGVDTAFETKIFKQGQKLTTKLFNASKFVLMQLEPHGNKVENYSISNPLDLSFVGILNKTIEDSTKALEQFEYSVALQSAETVFWKFCDDYLELVKTRSYQGDESAAKTLDTCLRTFLKLFAPFMPFVTEEIWSWLSNSGSVHKSTWPQPVSCTLESENIFNSAAFVLGKIHNQKSQEQRSLKWEVDTLNVSGLEDDVSDLQKGLADLVSAGKVKEDGVIIECQLEKSSDNLFHVEVKLAEAD